jgi:undecaprenyl-diphosphatase
VVNGAGDRAHPGISRSGMTMTAGLAQGMSRQKSARLTFLLGIPAIAGAAP